MQGSAPSEPGFQKEQSVGRTLLAAVVEEWRLTAYGTEAVAWFEFELSWLLELTAVVT